MNIQDFKDAIMLTEFVALHQSGNTTRYVYCLQSTGILYLVDPADGTILGQRYILDISFYDIV